jgi:hypothetical protein
MFEFCSTTSKVHFSWVFNWLEMVGVLLGSLIIVNVLAQRVCNVGMVYGFSIAGRQAVHSDRLLQGLKFAAKPDDTRKLDLPSFLDRVRRKPFSDLKTTIWPSTYIDMELTTRLVGATFGVEGQNVFPCRKRVTLGARPQS